MGNYFISGKRFKKENSESLAYLELVPAKHSEEWDVKQSNAIDEYIGEVEQADPQIDDIYKLFEDYIVRTIYGRKNLKILDVGCGIVPYYPKYASIFESEDAELQNVYIGLDPINYKIENRKYPFICGRVEDIPEKLDTKFDVFIFSSCLDHFEDIEKAAQAVKKIANKDALCIVWIGLHDTPFVAEQEGAILFSALYSNLNLFPFLFGLIKIKIKELANFWYYRKRERKLKSGQPLDNLHFHYFTEKSILPALQYFGDITDNRKVPGTSSRFYTVKLKN